MKIELSYRFGHMLDEIALLDPMHRSYMNGGPWPVNVARKIEAFKLNNLHKGQ